MNGGYFIHRPTSRASPLRVARLPRALLYPVFDGDEPYRAVGRWTRRGRRSTTSSPCARGTRRASRGQSADACIKRLILTYVPLAVHSSLRELRSRASVCSKSVGFASQHDSIDRCDTARIEVSDPKENAQPAPQDARCPSSNARGAWSPPSHRTEEGQPTRLGLSARLHTSKEITTARDAVARRSYTRHANRLSRRCSSTP